MYPAGRLNDSHAAIAGYPNYAPLSPCPWGMEVPSIGLQCSGGMGVCDSIPVRFGPPVP